MLSGLAIEEAFPLGRQAGAHQRQCHRFSFVTGLPRLSVSPLPSPPPRPSQAGAAPKVIMSDEIIISLAILRQAIRDWNNHQANRIELRAFLNSDWFRLLCDGNGIDPEVIRRRCKGYYALQRSEQEKGVPKELGSQAAG